MAVAMESGCWSSPKFGIGKKRGWGEDSNKLLQFMMGQVVHEESVTTLDLLGGSSSSCTSGSEVEQLELDLEVSPPSGWEKRLDLKLGRFYFVNLSTGRTTYENPSSSWSLQSEIDKIDTDTTTPVVDLKLELGMTRSSDNNRNISTIESVKEALRYARSPAPSSSTSSSSTSDKLVQERQRTDSKVFLTGCKMCLMYVMITSSDPRCPKCGSSVAPDIPVPSKKPRLELDL